MDKQCKITCKSATCYPTVDQFMHVIANACFDEMILDGGDHSHLVRLPDYARSYPNGRSLGRPIRPLYEYWTSLSRINAVGSST